MTDKKSDSFDEWFAERFPDYVYGKNTDLQVDKTVYAIHIAEVSF